MSDTGELKPPISANLATLLSGFVTLTRIESAAVGRAGKILAEQNQIWQHAERDDDFSEVNDNVKWDAIHAVLTHSANLSKIFFALKKHIPEYVQRCEIMRDLFSVTDASPLADWQFRNHYEHIDENLHKWVDDEAKPGGFIDQATGPGGLQHLFTNHYMLRTHERFGNTVTVGPLSLDLNAMIDESARIFTQAEQLLSGESGSWTPKRLVAEPPTD